jgi:hypothetical protein
MIIIGQATGYICKKLVIVTASIRNKVKSDQSNEIFIFTDQQSHAPDIHRVTEIEEYMPPRPGIVQMLTWHHERICNQKRVHEVRTIYIAYTSNFCIPNINDEMKVSGGCISPILVEFIFGFGVCLVAFSMGSSFMSGNKSNINKCSDADPII